jgi:hypothetical protein
MLRFGTAWVVGWDEPGVAVGAEVDLPAAVVNGGVVQSAEQHPVIQTGDTAAVPRLNVVGVAPGHGPAAAGVCAATIADGQSFPDRGREQPLTAPHIQRCPSIIDDHRSDRAVAGDQVGGGGADRATESQGVHRPVTACDQERCWGGPDEGDVREHPTGGRAP